MEQIIKSWCDLNKASIFYNHAKRIDNTHECIIILTRSRNDINIFVGSSLEGNRLKLSVSPKDIAKRIAQIKLLGFIVQHLEDITESCSVEEPNLPQHDCSELDEYEILEREINDM